MAPPPYRLRRSAGRPVSRSIRRANSRPPSPNGNGEAERAPPRAARPRSWHPRRQLQCVPHLAQQGDGALDRDQIALALWRVDLDPVLVLEVVDAEHRHDRALGLTFGEDRGVL